MATELAQAYVQIIPSMKGAVKSIETQLSGVNTNTVGQKIGRNIGSGISTNVQAAATSAVGAIGSIGGAIGQLAATGGFARALNVKKAQQMFQGMKLNYEDYKDTIMESVDGTAFAFDQAALVSASLAAAGVGAGDEMSRALHACTGVAATFGSDLGDIGTIFGKIAATGKVQADELNQLAERGVPAFQILSDQLGVSSEDIRGMVKDGEVNFQMFSDAMYNAFGDSASAANDSFTGSMANMKSALNKIGEKFANPIIDNAVPVFNALRLAINAVKDTIDPVVEKFTALVTTISGGLVGRINAFTEAFSSGAGMLKSLQAALGGFWGTVAAGAGVVGVIGAIGGALSGMLAGIPVIGSLVGAFAGGGGAVAAFGAAVKIATSPIAPFVAAIGTIIWSLKSVEGFNEKISAAFSAYKTNLSEGMSKADAFGIMLNSVFATVKESSYKAISALSWKITNFIRNITGIPKKIQSAFGSVRQTLSHITIGDTNMGQAFDRLVSVVKNGVQGIKNQFKPIADAFKPVTDAFDAFAKGLPAKFADLPDCFKPLTDRITFLQEKFAFVDTMADWDNLYNKVWYAVSLLVPGFVHLGNAAEEVEQPFTGLVGVFGKVAAAINPLAQNVASFISGFVSGFESVGGIGAVFESQFKTAVSVISALTGALSPVNVILRVVSGAFQNITGTNENFQASIFNAAAILGETLAPILMNLGQGILPAITMAINTVSSVIDALSSCLGGIIQGVFPAFISIVSSVVPVFGQIISTVAQVVAAFAPLVASIASQLLPVFGQVITTVAQIIAQATSQAMPIISQVVTAIGSILTATAPLITQLASSLIPIIGQVMSVLGQCASQIISALLPVISQVVTAVTEVANAVIPVVISAIQQIAPVVSQIIMVIAQVVAALAPLVATLVTTLIPIVTQVITLVVDCVSRILAAVIPAVSQIVSTIQENMPMIQSIIEQASATIQSVIETVWPVVESIITQVCQSVATFMEVTWPMISELISQVTSNILGFIEENWPTIEAIITMATEAISDLISTVWPVIETVISTAMDGIQAVITAVMQIINGDWEGAWNTISDFLGTAWESISQGVSDGIDGVIEWFVGLPDRIVGALGDVGGMLVQTGRDIVGGLLQGLGDFASGIAEWGGDIINNILEHKGPPEYDKVMLIPAGRAIMNSLLLGFESGEKSVFKHLSSFTDDLSRWDFGDFGNRGFEFKSSRSLTYQPMLDAQNQGDAPLVINGNVTLDASKFKSAKDLDEFRTRLYKELKMAKAGA